MQAPLTSSGCRGHSYGRFGEDTHTSACLLLTFRSAWSGHIVQGCLLRSVYWADIPGWSATGQALSGGSTQHVG